MPNTLATVQTPAIPAQVHSKTIDGTTYEVTSNYVGSISLLDLFKLMLKRDIEKLEN